MILKSIVSATFRTNLASSLASNSTLLHYFARCRCHHHLLIRHILVWHSTTYNTRDCNWLKTCRAKILTVVGINFSPLGRRLCSVNAACYRHVCQDNLCHWNVWKSCANLGAVPDIKRPQPAAKIILKRISALIFGQLPLNMGRVLPDEYNPRLAFSRI